MFVFLLLPVFGISLFYTGYVLQHLPEEEFDNNPFASAPVDCSQMEEAIQQQQETSFDLENVFQEDEDMYEMCLKH